MTKERARMVGNLTKKIKKCQMPGGLFGGEGIGTLGIDSYITSLFATAPFEWVESLTSYPLSSCSTQRDVVIRT